MLEVAQSSNRCQVMTDANGVAAAIEADLLDGIILEIVILADFLRWRLYHISERCDTASTFDVDGRGRPAGTYRPWAHSYLNHPNDVIECRYEGQQLPLAYIDRNQY
eukprot:scaffold21267_cov110-Skeletonema_marinoi.AAC.1